MSSRIMKQIGGLKSRRNTVTCRTTIIREMAKGSSVLTPVVTVDRGSSQPLHSQIYRSLRNAIATGVLRPGQRVPSSRAMGTELNVSRITILEAYGQLLAEGYFKSSRGAGTFVSSSLPEYLTQVGRPVNGRTPRTSGPRPVARRALPFPTVPVTPCRYGLGAFAVHQPAFEEFPCYMVAVGDAPLEGSECARDPLHRSAGLPAFSRGDL